MILEDKIGKVAKQGFHKPIKLSMEANAVGFRIIIKNIYTDPIKAIIRELGTNAIESHIKAGNTDKPFEVKLPTSANPEFVIRDYGTGITWEDLNNIYAVMFRSDKRDSNEYNGCFGIGSKSPYAYSDNFSLESYVDGTRYVYVCFIDAEGMPNIAPVEGTEGGILTDEENGVKISIPVAPANIYQFQNMAKEVYQYFRHKPTTNGIPIPTVSYKDTKYDDWKIRDGGGYMKIVMGDVAYSMTISDKMGKYQSLANQPIDLMVNIGDVSVDSGRERIVADPKTINYLKERLAGVVRDCESYITEQLESAKSLWELKCRARDIHNSFMANYASNITWNGKSYSLATLVQRIDLPTGSINHRFTPNAPKRRNISSVVAHESVHFVLLDKCAGPHVRCGHYANNKNVTVIGMACDDTVFYDFIKEYGITNYTTASTLHKPQATKTNFDKYKAVVKYTNKVSWFRATYNEYWTEDEDFDFTNGGYYVVVNRGAVIRDTRINPSQLQDAIDYLNSHETVYGVPKSLEQEFIDSDDWTNIYDLVKEKIDKQLVATNASLADYWSEQFVQKSDLVNIVTLAKSIRSSLTNPDFLDILNQPVPDLSKAQEVINNRNKFFGHIDAREPNDADKAKVDEYVKKVAELHSKYPLVDFVSRPYWRSTEYNQAIADYLNK